MTSILKWLEARSHGWTARIGFRLLGLALLGACAAAGWWLHRSVLQPPWHGTTALELAAAVAAVASWSLGSALSVEGPGLFRLVELPLRYRHLALLPTGSD